jgi:hypothetical protein
VSKTSNAKSSSDYCKRLDNNADAFRLVKVLTHNDRHKADILLKKDLLVDVTQEQ